MIAVASAAPAITRRRAGWFALAVSLAASVSLVVIAVAWPEAPPSAGAVPLNVADPESVALAFTQRHQAHDPGACSLATPRWRAQLGRRMNCLPIEQRPRPEVQVLSASREAESAVVVIAVRSHDQTPCQVTVTLALVEDRWLVDSTTPTPVEAR
ncbi:hypothetical protein [Saccharothrix syringae]|uniref:Uncharacterized protein n=1 Tax=Saccharothrix syringae TaxID=103733 RepID=A0A5Q0H4B1_SACSY|nr:hypothetical protein [Saccharothrix syringae]QFZ20572.1 hypothetical protein EKG83_27020 [Saccharothrix syringae]